MLVAWSLILGTGGFCSSVRCRTASGASRSSWPAVLIAAVTYIPVVRGHHAASPTRCLHAAHQTPITVTASEDDCSFQFNPTGTVKFTNSCDIAKAQLSAYLGQLYDRVRRTGQRGNHTIVTP